MAYRDQTAQPQLSVLRSFGAPFTFVKVVYDKASEDLSAITVNYERPASASAWPEGLISKFKPEIAYLAALCEPHVDKSCYTDQKVLEKAVEIVLRNVGYGSLNKFILDGSIHMMALNHHWSQKLTTQSLNVYIAEAMMDQYKSKQGSPTNATKEQLSESQQAVANPVPVAVEQHTKDHEHFASKADFEIKIGDLEVQMAISQGDTIIVKKRKRD